MTIHCLSHCPVSKKKLKRNIYYNQNTGVFTRKLGPKHGNRVVESGVVLNTGYVQVMVSGKRYQSHRLAFYIIEGYFPENDIDHINRIKNDNRWENLRVVSKSCNIKNTGLYLSNKTGVKGVCWASKKNKWQVSIRNKGKPVVLGMFNDFSEAVAHRLAAEQCLGWGGCDKKTTANAHMEKTIKKGGI